MYTVSVLRQDHTLNQAALELLCLCPPPTYWDYTHAAPPLAQGLRFFIVLTRGDSAHMPSLEKLGHVCTVSLVVINTEAAAGI